MLGLLASGCRREADSAPPPDDGPPAAAVAPTQDDASDDDSDDEESPYLDVANFNRTVESHHAEVVTCYQTTVGTTNDAPTGRLKTTVQVDSQGRVKDVLFDPQRSTLKDDALYACIRERAKTWKFNITLTGADTPMPYTFDLTASGLLGG